MKIFKCSMAILMLLSLISCTYVPMQQADIDPWLVTMSGNEQAKLDVEGKWRDPESEGMFGWGEGDILQDGNKIHGAIGSYSVKGVVSGETVHVVFFIDDKVYYTAKLEMPESGVLSGQYFKAADKEQQKGYPARFIIE